MLSGKNLRRADIITGCGLAILGTTVIAGASQMPIGDTYGGVPNPWYASPAALPFFIGGLLILGGITVAVKGLSHAGIRGLGGFIGRVLRAPFTRAGARRGGMVTALFAAYYLLLWLRLFGPANYVSSSTLFLAGFTLVFYRPAGKFPRLPAVVAIIVVSTGVAAGVAALFSGPLRVPLP